MRILLAEDDASFRGVLTRALAASGHTVEAAEDGVELLRLAGAFKPGLVLSDIDMPWCDGITACRLLRAALPETGFLLMTGDPDSAAAAERAGFAHVLLKPFELEQLMSQVAAR